MSLVSSIKAAVDPILSIRAGLGADIRPVSLVTRTWTGRVAGEGTVTEAVVAISPAPGIRNMTHAKKLAKEGGSAVEGDLAITGISKNVYTDEDVIGCRTSSKAIEKFYKVGSYFYEVLSVTEKHVTWEVMLRRKTDQRPASTWEAAP